MAKESSSTAQLVLANERTFLAWIRTSLALVVTGVALEAFEVPMPERWRQIAASLFILLGVAAAVQAWIGWKVTDTAVRSGESIPAPAIRLLIVVGAIAATLIVGIGLLLG